MPRPPRHPFTAVLRRALPKPRRPAAEPYLRLLDRRFAVLARISSGADPRATKASTSAPERRLARRFLAGRKGGWHDGDENLVRGYLDRWERGPAVRARARGLLEAAAALAGMRPPRGALWFFLWEMESVLAGLFEADKQERPC